MTHDRWMFVQDRNGRWFVRRVVSSVLHYNRDEVTYSAEVGLPESYEELADAVDALRLATGVDFRRGEEP